MEGALGSHTNTLSDERGYVVTLERQTEVDVLPFSSCSNRVFYLFLRILFYKLRWVAILNQDIKEFL